jgi:glutamate formiminotransferase / formiminotetrahydrofolate cyclodeaminase
MRKIVECVPNFSEGRDRARIEALVAAMRAVPGVAILDQEADADHHRSVITLAGEPEAVAQAALAGVGKAVQLIDLTHHRGAHPRIGATDVVPFVPIEGLELEDCVALARRVGREIWERYRIPVYFYEAAALRPERAQLENIRKGQFEGLREEVLTNPERAPDIGEPRLHPTAGAVVVGARKFLIAYNVNLNTADVAIANRVARSIRFSSGGLRYVKSMGVPLHSRNLAQVSINLTDFEQSPMHRVFELVRREAARYGAEVVGSEIVGLVPKKALEMAADFFLQFENFKPEMVLENRLAEALAGGAVTVGPPAGQLAAMATPLLEAVGAATATPGGGSVSALAGALAAALGRMVCALARKKKALAQYTEPLSTAMAELEAAAQTLAQAMDRDAAAYQAVLAAFKLPKEPPAAEQARDAAIQQATRGAAEVPMEVAESSANLYARLGQLESITPASMSSDLRVARLLAGAAAEGALANVRVNLQTINDASYVAAMKARVAEIENRLSRLPAAAAS